MKPILFNTEMVQANLNGLKSATRRVAFPNEDLREFPRPDNPDAWWFRGRVYTNWDSAMRSPQGVLSLCKYKKGDILYVRETWRVLEASYPPRRCKIEYRAGGTKEFNEIIALPTAKGEWKPSIHMPQKAARLFLRVTDVRVEMLQDISVEDAKKEGAFHACGMCAHWHDYCGKSVTMARDCEIYGIAPEFPKLWDSTIKPTDIPLYGWNANPWVWVIEYERCDKPEV